MRSAILHCLNGNHDACMDEDLTSLPTPFVLHLVHILNPEVHPIIRFVRSIGRAKASREVMAEVMHLPSTEVCLQGLLAEYTIEPVFW